MRSRDDFGRFLADLCATEREPIVVVSIAEGATSPAISVDELHEELGEAARLYVLPAETTFWLTDELGKKYSVFSGWVRVYPANPAWRTDIRRAPLLPARAHKRRWQQQIVDTVLQLAYVDGYRPQTTAPAAGVRATAVVEGYFSSTQVAVRMGRDGQAIMRTSHLWPGVPAERLVAVGQAFEGVRQPGNLLDEFVPDPVADDVAERAITFVGDGIVTSAKASEVTEDRAELLLHPLVPISVSDGDIAMHSVVSAGEVVTVEVIVLDGELIATFSAEEPGPSMSLLPGGPPWLVPASRATEPAAADAAAGVAATAAGVEEASPFEQEIEQLHTELQAEREKNRRLRQDLREQRHLSIPKLYADPREQLRLELHLSYLSRVSEPDRPRYPWPDTYGISDEFIATLDQLVKAGGIGRDKIVEVGADVLCGRAQHMPARAVKEWKESKTGPPLRRSDGAVAMRVRLQHRTNSARRLRYWRLPGGEIELDWVGVHDAELRGH